MYHLTGDRSVNDRRIIGVIPVENKSRQVARIRVMNSKIVVQSQTVKRVAWMMEQI